MARTCDLGQVVRQATDAASGQGPVSVAVSGFATSGKTTLATRLHERINGSVVVEADLLAETAPRLMTDRWAADRGKGLRQRMPGSAAVVIVEGRGLLHPELAALFQVRVWLDVGLEDAGMRRNLRRYEQSKQQGDPVGRWVAEEPPQRVTVDPVETEFFARFRPDRQADVLFVPVGGMATPIRLRFMTEIACDFVLWDEENEHLGELEYLLPIPDDLRKRVLHHAGQWYRQDGGEADPGWPGDEEFDRRGYLLSRELQDALGQDYRVMYSFSTAEAQQWAAQRD